MTCAIRSPTPGERRMEAWIDAYFTELGQGVNPHLERAARMHEIRRLDALSDEALLARGIRRERIPHHVFGDRFRR